MRYKICDYKVLKKQTAKEFKIEKDAFLIYFKKNCYAYENSCPHTGVNLNWQEGQFFSVDGLYLECSMHGALFDPVTGACIRGPCVGSNLKKINISIENDVVYVNE